MGWDYGNVVQYPPSTEELDTRFKVGINEAVRLQPRVLLICFKPVFHWVIVKKILVMETRRISLGHEADLHLLCIIG